MWHTADGTRTLTGAEARLIRDTAWDLVDAIRAEKSLGSTLQFGIVLFDQLTWQQQVVMLAKALRPLLIPSIGPPTPTALLDATVAAIYAQMQTNLQCEIDVEQTSPQNEEGDTERRQQILEVIREHGAEGNWPDAECVVMDMWELAIAEIQSWVLADEDWQLDDRVARSAAGQESRVQANIGNTGRLLHRCTARPERPTSPSRLGRHRGVSRRPTPG